MVLAKAIDIPTSWEQDHAREAADSEIVLELYDREQLSLRRYLIYLGLDRETAVEIVQESFLRLQQHLLAGGDRTHLRAWLFRVAHNLGRNAQTSSRVSRTGALEESVAGQQAIDHRESPEERVVARQSEERVREALRQLSPTQRNCLMLRSQGLKYREIGEALDLSVSTVAEHVQRGLDRLKGLV